MAYILFVNAQILSSAGMPREDVVIATALSSAVATLVMGLAADYPFALAPGMGLNAYFAYAVVGGMGLDWRQALGAVLVAGVAFLALTITGIRRTVLAAIPAPIKVATSGGIGLFLALVGLQNAGLVVDDRATLVGIGELGASTPLLALVGLALMGILLARGVDGALLIGIAAVTVLSWFLGAASFPARLVSVPRLPTETFLAFEFGRLDAEFGVAVVAFLFVDLFDTAGTLFGVGRLGGFVDERGDLPRAGRAFFADAVGTTVGACLGTSPVTTYVESATGIEEGGRTGLTAVTTATLFLLALLFTPLFVAVPAAATAPALVVVGAFMVRGVRDIDWRAAGTAIPAFLTMIVMPFTYSIANGIAAGILSYVLIATAAGETRRVHPLMYVISVLIVLFYALVHA